MDEMHIRANLSILANRRIHHVYNFIYKHQSNHTLLDIHDIRTRAHDAVLYTTNRPNCEKFKHNVFFYGARLWNQLPVHERKIDNYESFKNVQKKEMTALN